ncbi:hypothetical protein RHMOL_Rhmol06G0155900 [Rhododendron molle]|uniref:Uncharacterized protein n=1 Tax=Rhododendron molle TaxID=49168 RepID=A0ACC0NCK9_RHOML|nr:hypothetical protein RHMOL_Rhmol06G0155900 [Rhododendron molle]
MDLLWLWHLPNDALASPARKSVHGKQSLTPNATVRSLVDASLLRGQLVEHRPMDYHWLWHCCFGKLGTSMTHWCSPQGMPHC